MKKNVITKRFKREFVNDISVLEIEVVGHIVEKDTIRIHNDQNFFYVTYDLKSGAKKATQKELEDCIKIGLAKTEPEEESFYSE